MSCIIITLAIFLGIFQKWFCFRGFLRIFLPKRNSHCSVCNPCSGITSRSNIFSNQRSIKRYRKRWGQWWWSCWSSLLVSFAHEFCAFLLFSQKDDYSEQIFLVSSSFAANSTSSSSFQTCHHDYDDMTVSKPAFSRMKYFFKGKAQENQKWSHSHYTTFIARE